MRGSPFQCLKTSNGRANQSVNTPYPDAVGELMQHTRDVAHSQRRKVAVVWLSSGRVYAKRAGGAIARAGNVGAHHIPTLRIQEFAALHRAGPPVGHVAIGSKGMTHPHHIVFGLVELAKSVVSNGQFRHNGTRLGVERLREVIVLYHSPAAENA